MKNKEIFKVLEKYETSKSWQFPKFSPMDNLYEKHEKNWETILKVPPGTLINYNVI